MVVSVTNDLKVVSTVREGCCESLILSALLGLLLDELKEENGMDGRERERERDMVVSTLLSRMKLRPSYLPTYLPTSTHEQSDGNSRSSLGELERAKSGCIALEFSPSDERTVFHSLLGPRSTPKRGGPIPSNHFSDRPI